jgi:uracil-DNA glycosylase
VAAASRRPWPGSTPAGRSPAPSAPDVADGTGLSGPVLARTVPSGPVAPATSQDRRDEVSRASALDALREEVASCTRCPLYSTRTQSVFGAGHPDADLLFVGEAPGYHEDQQGVPFVGQAGKLLEQLLAGIGLTRADVYIANVLKSRPPGNRDPQPDEIAACEGYLFRQIELIKPLVVATLGNFATKLLSGKPLGITRVHGREQQTTLGGRTLLLYPLYHPAAALYTPAMLKVLESDFARLPDLLGRPVEAPTARSDSAEPEPVLRPEPAVQLGLF